MIDYLFKYLVLCFYTFVLCVSEVSIVLFERIKVEFIESFWKINKLI